MLSKHRQKTPSTAGIRYQRLVAGLCLYALFSFSAAAQPDADARARTFLMFCAGCHGQDGFAAYENAPSFSMGEQLQKDDRELLQSVLNGTNEMPPWRDMLPVQDLRNAIAYIRLMHERKSRGESPRQVKTPDRYYRFKPVGEDNMDWDAKEGR